MAWRQFASSPAYTGARDVTTAAHADRWWWCLDTKIKSDHLCWRSVFEIEWETDLICLLSQRRLGQLSLGSWQQRLWPWMGSEKIWLESRTGWRADGAAYRAAAHTDSNSGWCRQHVVMLHPPSAAVRRSAYGPLCQLSNQMVSPFGGSDRSVRLCLIMT